MAHYKVRQGYTVPISGEASRSTDKLGPSPFVGVCPVDFEHIKAKLLVAVNDEIKIGSPLFRDKVREECLFVSPASGRIAAINYGPRRVIEEIVIATDEQPQHVDHQAFDIEALADFSREALLDHLQKGGVWPFMRQRPFNRIADIKRKPKSIFVNCTDSAPLANDPNYSLKENDDWFEAGVEAMKILSDGKVHVVTDAKGAHAGFTRPRGVSYHTVAGKHPRGLVGTHISHIDPLNRGECVWTIAARDLVLIGGLLLTGQFQNQRTVAIAGTGSSKRRYVKSQMGAKISHLIQDSVKAGEQRIISGNILTGKRTSADSYLGYYDDLVTIIPEGRHKHFLGWMLPVFNIPSFGRALPTGFMPNKKFDMTTNLNGGHRAIVQSGIYDQVMALDIHPEFLIKAAMAGDIDTMEKLGMLECDPEDFALCSYICPSKTDVMSIVKQGLELMEKEG